MLCGMVCTGILNILGVFDAIFSDMDATISPRRTWSRGSLLKQMNPLVCYFGWNTFYFRSTISLIIFSDSMICFYFSLHQSFLFLISLREQDLRSFQFRKETFCCQRNISGYLELLFPFIFNLVSCFNPMSQRNSFFIMKRKHIFFMESNISVSTWPVLLFNVFG